jgi:hypothetical protein
VVERLLAFHFIKLFVVFSRVDFHLFRRYLWHQPFWMRLAFSSGANDFMLLQQWSSEKYRELLNAHANLMSGNAYAKYQFIFVSAFSKAHCSSLRMMCNFDSLELETVF